MSENGKVENSWKRLRSRQMLQNVEKLQKCCAKVENKLKEITDCSIRNRLLFSFFLFQLNLINSNQVYAFHCQIINKYFNPSCPAQLTWTLWCACLPMRQMGDAYQLSDLTDNENAWKEEMLNNFERAEQNSTKRGVRCTPMFSFSVIINVGITINVELAVPSVWVVVLPIKISWRTDCWMDGNSNEIFHAICYITLFCKEMTMDGY